ncbi:MAG: hypothetical protein JO112_11225 [Planctomycetes bacterium]|nr:hypothetical protein [Planctomycetota bacterium]
MTRLILDSNTLAKMNNLNDLLEIRDESGRLLGYFHPFISSTGPQQGARRSPFTDEELQQRRQEPGGKPLSEILKNLPS